jgi:hypothetical protein
MARETVAQRNARFDAERDARLAQEVAEYPARLMLALEEATRENNYELTVKRGEFFVRDRNTGLGLDLPPTYTFDGSVALESLEFDLQEAAKARAHARARAAVREAALSKLTAEERQELGL